MLTGKERERYSRQIMLPGFGEEGQEKLKRARVLVAGGGGLGSPVTLYLAAAGVGTIRIVDNDRVEPSNLNRQILHGDVNIGVRKVDSARETLTRLNPDVKIEAIEETVSESSVNGLADGCDLIVDAMDNMPGRYLLNRAAVGKGIPLFHGAVNGFEGRAMTVIPGKTACLNCVYRGASPPEGKFPVIGVTPGVIGCIQATEVIKYIVGLGGLLTDTLLVYDGLDMSFARLKVRKDPGCEHCGGSIQRSNG